MTQYAKRKIDVTTNLGEGQLDDDKGKDVTLSGLKASAAVIYYGGEARADSCLLLPPRRRFFYGCGNRFLY